MFLVATDCISAFTTRMKNRASRRTLSRRLSPYSIVKLLITTFIGNILLSLLCIIPPLVTGSRGTTSPGTAQKRTTRASSTCLFWAAYNILASWVLNFLTELIPRAIVLLVGVVWGEVNKTIKARVDRQAVDQSDLLLGHVLGLLGSHLQWHLSPLRPHRDRPLPRPIHRNYPHHRRTAVLLHAHPVPGKTTAANHQYEFPSSGLRGSDSENHPNLRSDRCLERLPSEAQIFPAGTQQSPAVWGDPDDERARGQEGGPRAGDGQEEQMVVTQPGALAADGRQGEGGLRSPDARDGPVQYRVPEGSALPPPAKQAILTPDAPQLADNACRAGRASAAKIARAAMKDPVWVVGKKSGLNLDVNNPAEARKLAWKIYFGFKPDSARTYLVPSDFYPAFPTHELAKEAFSIFDSAGSGNISRMEVKNEIFRAYKERRALANSLQDVGHAIGRLDRIMMAMAGIVFVFIALSIVGIDYSKALASVYTVGIAAAFIFKETAGNVFDAIIMVFCTHPYDTGDRVIMDKVLVVKWMGLLSGLRRTRCWARSSSSTCAGARTSSRMRRCSSAGRRRRRSWMRWRRR
ncbi:hypothetical protein PtA15_11A564 [Puccinia triticina]|uniref:EF-hand domain-containing protein n=1 Tax=Puccinia triticina TaxID=208348 RepID=A0ABY7CZL0_9BASI|nr:uncharacterized protein PtA15_11A564 [Puccinia triticina]WAQ89872.1 hypothetical protein PtA15_11A564 [Puccinia triticina]